MCDLILVLTSRFGGVVFATRRGGHGIGTWDRELLCPLPGFLRGSGDDLVVAGLRAFSVGCPLDETGGSHSIAKHAPLTGDDPGGKPGSGFNPSGFRPKAREQVSQLAVVDRSRMSGPRRGSTPRPDGHLSG